MTATKVDYTNMFSQGWQNIYDLINNRTNVADPVTTNPSRERKFVYSREPVMEDIKYEEAPYIVVGPIRVDTSGSQTVDAKKGPVGFSCTIQVITSDRAYGNRDGQGAVDNDAIADDIFTTLNNVTNRLTLRNNGMPEFRVKMSAAIPEELYNTLAFRRIITVTSLNRMKRVSA